MDDQMTKEQEIELTRKYRTNTMTAAEEKTFRQWGPAKRIFTDSDTDAADQKEFDEQYEIVVTVRKKYPRRY